MRRCKVAVAIRKQLFLRILQVKSDPASRRGWRSGLRRGEVRGWSERRMRRADAGHTGRFHSPTIVGRSRTISMASATLNQRCAATGTWRSLRNRLMTVRRSISCLRRRICLNRLAPVPPAHDGESRQTGTRTLPGRAASARRASGGHPVSFVSFALSV